MAHSKTAGPRRVVLTCPGCHEATPATPGVLLAAAAQALNACRGSGMNLRVKHGALQCEEGLLLDLPDGTWVARTRLYTEFTPPPGDDFDD